MNRADFVILETDQNTGSTLVFVNFAKGGRQRVPELDRHCPLFGDHVLQNPLRVKRLARPPVVWVDQSGHAWDIFLATPWPLHINNPRPGVWSTRFADTRSAPNGFLHLELSQPLTDSRAMVIAGYGLPRHPAQATLQEEETYRGIHKRTCSAFGTATNTRPGRTGKSRTDLRDRFIFSIDNDDSKDLDDALEIHQVRPGQFIVGVHVADVSAYVQPDSPRDIDARDRATSHYFDSFVLHMLPGCLAQDLCSLLPEKDRLAMSLYLEIHVEHDKAVIKGSRLFPSLIRSKRRLSYSQANAALAGEPAGIDPELVTSLRLAKEIGRALRAARPSPLGQGNDHGVSGDLIENFMVSANQYIGEYMARTLGSMKNNARCCLFRVQASPKTDKLLAFASNLRAVGLLDVTDETLLREAEDLHKRHFSRQTKSEDAAGFDTALYRTLHSHLPTDPRSGAMVAALAGASGGIFKAAKVDVRYQQSSHHSLGISRYAWFTSPIRRYPDLVNHRFVHSILAKKRHSQWIDDPQAIHSALAAGRRAQQAYEQRRTFESLLADGCFRVPTDLACTPLKFQRPNPYVFMITANVHDRPVRIVLRDPEQAEVDRHGLQCLIRISGGPAVRLQVGDTFRLRLREDGVIPEMCWLMAHAADFYTGVEDHENSDH